MTDIMFLYTKGFEIEVCSPLYATWGHFQSLDGKYDIELYPEKKTRILVKLNPIEEHGPLYARLRCLAPIGENSDIHKLQIPEQIFNVIADTGSSCLDRMLEGMGVTALIALYDHRNSVSRDKYLDPPPSSFPIKIKQNDSLMDLLLDWTDYYHNNCCLNDDDDYFRYWYPNKVDNGYCAIMQKLETVGGTYSDDIVKEPYFITGETTVIRYATKLMGLLYRIPNFVLDIIGNNQVISSKYKEVFTEYNQKHDEFVSSIANFKEQHGQFMKKVI